MESQLLPLNLAEEFERIDKVYRRRLGDARWAIRRWELRSVIDEVIIAILSDKTGLPSERLLRKLPNETLVFYFDRLLCLQESLKELARDRTAWFASPQSWTEFWIELLVNSAAPPDPDSM
jgi:hypothetical protein